MSISVFSATYLNELVSKAEASPRRRQHKNLHTDYADPCQRLFNAIEPDSYLRPHSHGLAQGSETMIAVRGLMALVVFDNQGNVVEMQKFGAGVHASEHDVAVGTETLPGTWHSILSLEPGSILLELKAGPFDPAAPKFPAPWAPAEGSDEGQCYLSWMREHCVTWRK